MSWRNKLKWGDESLKTPEHDALMIWLDENCVSIAKKLFPELDENGYGRPLWEEPLTTKTGSILCFIDLFLSAKETKRKDYQKSYDLLFEVKPKIESIGELLRQLKSYEHYQKSQRDGMYGMSNSCKIIVVSPDTKATEIILRQGFYFFNPDDFKDETNN